jgi:hypothetical protein
MDGIGATTLGPDFSAASLPEASTPHIIRMVTTDLMKYLSALDAVFIVERLF